MRLGGVDEAGRGCLVGPLIVAGVCASHDGIARLRELGVKDSKKLSRKKRESLYPEIVKAAHHVYWKGIPPEEIDTVVMFGRRLRKLNYLEAVYFARVIDELGADRVTVDASDVVPRRFGRDIAKNLESSCKIVSLHKADRDFPVVSAASVIAKVERDRQVEMLKEQHGDFGSGYPSDPVTRSFFSEWMRSGRSLPSCARRSWKTFANIEQKLIEAYYPVA